MPPSGGCVYCDVAAVAAGLASCVFFDVAALVAARFIFRENDDVEESL